MQCPIEVTTDEHGEYTLVYIKKNPNHTVPIYNGSNPLTEFLLRSIIYDLEQYVIFKQKSAQLKLIDELARCLTQVDIPDLEARKLIALVKGGIC